MKDRVLRRAAYPLRVMYEAIEVKQVAGEPISFELQLVFEPSSRFDRTERKRLVHRLYDLQWVSVSLISGTRANLRSWLSLRRG